MGIADNSIRPFFLSAGLDLDALPPELQAALEQIVLPLYARYVLSGLSPLETAMGASLAFLMAQEVVSQFAISHESFGCLTPTPVQAASRQQEIDRYLRLLGAKGRCATFLQRLAEFRSRKDFDPIRDSELFNKYLYNMSVAQPVDNLARFLAAHAGHLRQQGSIVDKFRSRNGRRFGPYQMLTYRDAQGRQRAVYLAGEEELARARTALAALQAPRRQAQVLARARQALRRGHRAVQARLAQELQRVGLRLQGTEFRGWSRLKHSILMPADIPNTASGTAGLRPNSGESEFC